MIRYLVILVILAGCSPAAPPPEPFGAVPSERQLAWHELSYYAFIHFGPNTFTDVEWGHGDENPEVFNPTEFDARQWARVIRDAGMEGVIITAKHHDGFALWPSNYSTHTVRESAWRDGKGDALAELAEACAEYGLKFGVYVSPWDRNHPKYGTDEYNDVFKAMLEEVLTSYGPIFEVWFDGANGEGPNGKKQVYDFPGFAEVVREHQPMAVIFSDAGPDIRWVGNERGYAGETNWSTVNDGAFYPGIPGVNDQLQAGHEDGDIWLPTEIDTSIRPGWFYHRDQDTEVRPLEELIDVWFHSVGRNGNLLLNLPVDDRGLIHENDAERLMELRSYLDRAFQDNLAAGAGASATRSGYPASLTLDGDPNTYWATPDGVTAAELIIDLGGAAEVNTLLMQEYIALGQRVRGFTVSAEQDGAWVEVARGTTIGNRRILRWNSVTTERLKVVVDAKAPIVISNVEAYRVP